MNIRITSSTFAATLGIGFGLCVATSIARADDRADLGQITAQWWQWAFSVPLSLKPIADSTGASCMIGQSGALRFLAGNFGGSTVRVCSMPAGTTLFFPVVNMVGYNSPGCGQGPEDIPVKLLRKAADDFIDSVSLRDLHVTLDSQPVYPFSRVQSDVFAIALPADNIGGCAPGVYSPAVDDGYYVKLDALKAGAHTAHSSRSPVHLGCDLSPHDRRCAPEIGGSAVSLRLPARSTRKPKPANQLRPTGPESNERNQSDETKEHTC